MLSTATRSFGFKPVLAAACLALSASAAQAYDGDLGSLTPHLSSTFQIGSDYPSTTFTDTLDFSLGESVLASFAVKGQGFVIPSFLTLAGASDLSLSVYKGEALLASGVSLSGLSLAAGTDYSFAVSGKQGGYTVTWSLTPIPEPATLALVLSGLLVAGTLMRRRAPGARQR